jgi:DNA anti-recombination protein RmuC
VIQQLTEQKGHKRTIELLKEKQDQAEQFGEEWEWANKKIEEVSKQFKEMRIPDIAEEIKSKEAAEGISYLRQEVQRLRRESSRASRTLSQALRTEVLPKQIETIIRDLRKLVRDRDRLQERIAESEERHAKRVEETKAKHNERLKEMEEDKQERLEDAADSYQDRLDDIAEREKQAYEKMSKDLATAFDPTERIFSKQAVSAQRIEENMRVQREQIERWADDVNRLMEAGLNRDVVSAMGLDDPRNFHQARRLVEDMMADPSMIESINEEWSQRLQITEQFSKGPGSQIQEDFAEMRDEAKKAYDEQTKEINQAHEEAVQKQKENHREQLEDMKNNLSQTIDDIKSEIADLAVDATRTVDQLIQEGINSGIEGIEKQAEALRKALKTQEELNRETWKGVQRKLLYDWPNTDRSTESDENAGLKRLQDQIDEIQSSSELFIETLIDIQVDNALKEQDKRIGESSNKLEDTFSGIIIDEKMKEQSKKIDKSSTDLQDAIDKATDRIDDRFKKMEEMFEGSFESTLGLGTRSMSMSGNATASGELQSRAKGMLSQFGWDQSQFPALKELWQRESGWDPTAANPNSSARGIPQAMMSVHYGSNWQSDPAAQQFLNDPQKQMEWGMNYIKKRYGSPEAALRHYLSRQPINGVDQGNWYQSGGVFNVPTRIGVGERGREAVVPLQTTEGISALSGALQEAMGEQEMGPTFHVDRVVAHDPNKMARDLKRIERRKRMGGGV